MPGGPDKDAAGHWAREEGRDRAWNYKLGPKLQDEEPQKDLTRYSASLANFDPSMSFNILR